MNNSHTYETVTEALNDLSRRGYDLDFSIQAEQDCLICNAQGIQLSPDEFEIDEVHRFEGMTDPGDQMVIYAISSPKYGVKGTVVNGYGVYSSSRSSDIVKKLI